MEIIAAQEKCSETWCSFHYELILYDYSSCANTATQINSIITAVCTVAIIWNKN